MTERSVEQLKMIVDAITITLREAAEDFGLTPQEIATVNIAVCAELGYDAWGDGVIEHFRTQADFLERERLAAQNPAAH